MKHRVPRSSASGRAGSGGEDTESKNDPTGPFEVARLSTEELSADAAPSPRKLGLRFILHARCSVDAWEAPPSAEAQHVPLWSAGETGCSVAVTPAAATCAEVAPPRALMREPKRTRCLDSAGSHDETRTAKHSAPATPRHAQALTLEKTQVTASKKRGRTCKADGCDNYSVHKGHCCRHGGGKKCSVDGCDSSAKRGGRCWKHGGSVECKISECTKKAKAKGLCWAHGGGAKCQGDACAKVAISNGFCWAHGGGRRCIFDGCQRPAFERTHSFCLRHYDSLQEVDYYEV